MPTVTSASAPSSSRTLALRWAAALLVNVSPRIWSGRAWPDCTRCRMRRAMTVVLPVPAPATSSCDDAAASTASTCSAVSSKLIATPTSPALALERAQAVERAVAAGGVDRRLEPLLADVLRRGEHPGGGGLGVAGEDGLLEGVHGAEVEQLELAGRAEGGQLGVERGGQVVDGELEVVGQGVGPGLAPPGLVVDDADALGRCGRCGRWRRRGGRRPPGCRSRARPSGPAGGRGVWPSASHQTSSMA